MKKTSEFILNAAALITATCIGREHPLFGLLLLMASVFHTLALVDPWKLAREQGVSIRERRGWGKDAIVGVTLMVQAVLVCLASGHRSALSLCITAGCGLITIVAILVVNERLARQARQRIDQERAEMDACPHFDAAQVPALLNEACALEKHLEAVALYMRRTHQSYASRALFIASVGNSLLCLARTRDRLSGLITRFAKTDGDLRLSYHADKPKTAESWLAEHDPIQRQIDAVDLLASQRR